MKKTVKEFLEEIPDLVIREKALQYCWPDYGTETNVSIAEHYLGHSCGTAHRKDLDIGTRYIKTWAVKGELQNRIS